MDNITELGEDASLNAVNVTDEQLQEMFEFHKHLQMLLNSGAPWSDAILHTIAWQKGTFDNPNHRQILQDIQPGETLLNPVALNNIKNIIKLDEEGNYNV